MTEVFDSCFATPGKMMPLGQARDIMAQMREILCATETVPLHDLCGRILADDVIAPQTVPPHDNSAMDGYALKGTDIPHEGDVRLPIVGRVPAGHLYDGVIQSGEVARIFTGAPIPAGTDTVIMQENVREEEGFAHFSAGAAKIGANVRKAGEDIKKGDVVLQKGRRLRAADCGVLASLGFARALVYAPLRVAVFSTGDEICDVTQDLKPGHVYDANRYTIMSLLKGLGCEVTDLGILPDDLERIATSLKAAADHHDVLFTSGGVSLGEEDHVKAAVERHGRLNFWRIAIKPGRPIALGEVGTTPLIGLPGNPVASMVTFMTIARPLLLGWSGCADRSTPMYKIPAAFNYSHKGGRFEWQRAYLKQTENGPVVDLFHTTGSGILTSMVVTDGLVELDDNAAEIKVGDPVSFIPFNEVSM